jgi:hypothetical protein
VVAERIRRRIEERFARGRSVVTISGGIAVFPDDAGTPADLIVQADAGLYGAKAAGKNRILLPQGERRRFRRQTPPGGVTIGTRAGRASARVKNVSEGGLLVSLREAVPLGSAVSLTIERAGGTPVGLRGEVVRVERVPGEVEPAFDVGVRFLDPEQAVPLLSRS